MIRRLKADVLAELPPKRRQIIPIDPGADVNVVRKEWEAFPDLKERIDAAQLAGDEESYRRAVAELDGLYKIEFTKISKLRHETAVAKIPYVIEHLRDALEEGAKVVCFAHHRDVIAALAAEFGEMCVVVYGDTPAPERQSAVDRFQSGPDCRLFVGGITVAGTGITLTASSRVVFAEYDWRPGVMSQAEDRCHRIGQRESLLVQYLVFDGSIDAIMATRNVKKAFPFLAA